MELIKRKKRIFNIIEFHHRRRLLRFSTRTPALQQMADRIKVFTFLSNNPISLDCVENIRDWFQDQNDYTSQLYKIFLGIITWFINRNVVPRTSQLKQNVFVSITIITTRKQCYHN